MSMPIQNNVSTRKTFAIMGATSDVGQTVIKCLTADGHVVRQISRSAGVSLDDSSALEKAFEGVDGVYVMLPFDMTAADLHGREDEMIESIAKALQNATVPRVVLLSAASAHLQGHTGTSMGVARMERRLEGLDIPELIFVRAGFFMENFVKGMDFMHQVKAGVYRSPFKSGRPMPMVAAKDVGEYVARMLIKPLQTKGVITHEVLGAQDYTFAEATRILGTTLGNPQMYYEQVGYEDAQDVMISQGVPASFTEAVMETARSFNNDEVWARETRGKQNTTRTTLEEFAHTLKEAQKQHA